MIFAITELKKFSSKLPQVAKKSVDFCLKTLYKQRKQNKNYC